MDFLEQIRNEIKNQNLLKPGAKVIVGVSGGADSVCLLKVLSELKNELKIELLVVHINHGLRGAEADNDQKHVEKLCRDWLIPIKIYFVNIKKLSAKLGISDEEAGRIARYKVFSNVLKMIGGDCIAVAHNREDQAETVMMNILRGSGIDGLCGMSVKRGEIIRPLLNVSRADIEKYLEDNKISYCIDSSNKGVEYTRNRIRNELFPKIEELFEVNPANQLIRLSKLIEDDREFLENEARKAYDGILLSDSDSLELSLSGLRILPNAIIKRIIRIAWERISNSRKNIEAIHVDQIITLCQNGRTGKAVNLPKGFSVSISYDRLIFAKGGKNNSRSYSYPVKREGITVVKEANGALDSCVLSKEEYLEKNYNEKIKENSLIQFFDLDKLQSGVEIRSRRQGDRIRPYTAKIGVKGSTVGEKKLKDYFIDKKIPRQQRETIPVIASGNRVAWIVGMRTSEEFRAREDTKNIWMLSWCDFKNEGEQENAED